MREISALRVVAAALSSALGVTLAACGTTSNDPGGTDGGSSRLTAGTCGSPQPLLGPSLPDTGFISCSEGFVHRAAIKDCPVRPSGTCGDTTNPSGTCSRDTDCTQKPNGICALGESSGAAAPCGCVYGCVRDSDCGSDQICECGTSVGRCVSASCKQDSDCGPSSFCASAPSAFGGCNRAPNRYLCQTTKDACLGNDCPREAGAGDLPMCGYSEASGARACGQSPLPCPGRPFIVAETARLAPVMARRDWCGGAHLPDVHELSEASRGELARHWTRVGQMEHASVAAFARFALELLALGAPGWALAETSAAMADETAHAHAAFLVASAYAGYEIGPAALSIEGALGVGAPSARAVLATLLREGCLGETLAAIEATEALHQAEDPAIRAVLERIAADETRHAALAWRTMAWLLDRGDRAFREWAKQELESALAERTSSLMASARDTASTSDEARAHGLLPARLCAEVGLASIRGIVVPCADAIFSSVAPLHGDAEAHGARPEQREWTSAGSARA